MNSDAVFQHDSEGGLAVLISPAGSLTFVWDDTLQPLCDLGRPTIKRASHVEPIIEGENAGQWAADMGPSGGPVLPPRKLRSEALAAEREWLRDHRGL